MVLSSTTIHVGQLMTLEAVVSHVKLVTTTLAMKT
jgi:hypothetical protein